MFANKRLLVNSYLRCCPITYHSHKRQVVEVVEAATSDNAYDHCHDHSVSTGGVYDKGVPYHSLKHVTCWGLS